MIECSGLTTLAIRWVREEGVQQDDVTDHHHPLETNALPQNSSTLSLSLYSGQ